MNLLHEIGSHLTGLEQLQVISRRISAWGSGRPWTST
jgi:hypothetical protein